MRESEIKGMLCKNGRFTVQTMLDT